jgi:hypothetical protein
MAPSIAPIGHRLWHRITFITGQDPAKRRMRPKLPFEHCRLSAAVFTEVRVSSVVSLLQGLL